MLPFEARSVYIHQFHEVLPAPLPPPRPLPLPLPLPASLAHGEGDVLWISGVPQNARPEPSQVGL